jgi:phosphoribosylanthranilate isomerase
VTRVKICGITNREDALAAAEAGADALGFIFVPGTSRQVSAAVARAIIAELPPFVLPVGVFLNAGGAEIRAAIEQCGLGAVQLHGSEPPDLCAGLPRPVLKTIHVRGPESLEAMARYRPAAFLLDAHAEDLVGGRGQAIDWTLAAAAARRGRVILSGGLRPESVAAAVRTVRPYGVDVCSGVERAPGIKEPARVREFIRRAREAGDA